MSYRLSFEQPLPGEVRRVAREQLHDAIAGLRDPGADRVAAVHDARKAIKKVRALLRLVEPGLPRAAFRRENRALRDAGRLLSGTRDADVLVQAADDLRERYAGRVPAVAFTAVHDELRRRRGAAADVDGPARAAAAALEAIAARVDAWPLRRVDAAAARAGMAITYSRGRRALKAAAAAPSDTALHDWRKRVKDLWYHERLLAELWPGVLKAQAHETKRLSEHLGDDHDLAELRHVLRSDHADDAFDEELVALVAERRAELQQEALALGRRVYADRPAALRRRLARWSAVAAGTGAGAAVGV